MYTYEFDALTVYFCMAALNHNDDDGQKSFIGMGRIDQFMVDNRDMCDASSLVRLSY